MALVRFTDDTENGMWTFLRPKHYILRPMDGGEDGVNQPELDTGPEGRVSGADL